MSNNESKKKSIKKKPKLKFNVIKELTLEEIMEGKSVRK